MPPARPAAPDGLLPQWGPRGLGLLHRGRPRRTARRVRQDRAAARRAGGADGAAGRPHLARPAGSSRCGRRRPNPRGVAGHVDPNQRSPRMDPTAASLSVPTEVPNTRRGATAAASPASNW